MALSSGWISCSPSSPTQPSSSDFLVVKSQKVEPKRLVRLMHELPPYRNYRKNVEREYERISQLLRSLLKLACSGKLHWPLTLLGGPGNGKTCACLFYCDITRGSLYITHRNLADEYQKVLMGCYVNHKTGDRISIDEFWQRFSEFRLVVIDDVLIGKSMTSYCINVLQHAIHVRIHKPLILISSHTPDFIREEFEPELIDDLLSGTAAVAYEKPVDPGKNTT